MSNVIVKQGPLVFLRDLLVMECVAFAVFFAASFLKNYEMLYRSWSLDQYLRYDLFILVASSLFQFPYITILFINWYFSYYEIKEREIIKKSGIFSRRRKSINLSNVISVETHQNLLDRAIDHATIVLEHEGGRVTKIKNISNAKEHIHIIKRLIQNISKNHFSLDLQFSLKQGEGENLEFKETLRFDTKRNEVNKELQNAIIKSIVGFLNADGGTLLIGVNDRGEIMGLERDYQSLQKKNRDGLENHLVMLVKTSIGLSFTKYITIHFESMAGKEVCLISVRESHKPAYFKNESKKEEFFVRTGNSTQPYSMSEAEEYIRTHF